METSKKLMIALKQILNNDYIIKLYKNFTEIFTNN